MRKFTYACAEDLLVSRRSWLAGAASLAVWSALPRSALAQGRDPRFLAVILRGALDGISLAAPAGDANYAPLRPHLAVPTSGTGAGLPLDGFFVLNGNMPFLHELYRSKQALIVHAVASPYRGRSHFDGQDVLESGLGGVGRIDEGWLNRALTRLPAQGSAAPMKGLAVGAVVPLVMRGAAPVLSWIPQAYSVGLRSATVDRLMDLYNHADPKLALALAEGLEIDRMAPTAVVAAEAAQPAVLKPGSPGAAGGRVLAEFVKPAEAAARILSAADGPRIGALSYNGWDTHANEGVLAGQLGTRLAALDAAIKALHDGMGEAWKQTVVAVVTEFGRTVRVNGTDGTDHGTATVALLVGGAVRGGRVTADWPGLAETALFEGRDLAPTCDLRGVLKGVLRDHLGLPDGVLATVVFPQSAQVAPMEGLIA